jgi:hypothetical protein
MLLKNLLLIQPQTFQLPAPDCTRGTKHSVENSSPGLPHTICFLPDSNKLNFDSSVHIPELRWFC